MRIQVFIRDDLAEVLNNMAWIENRWPKQQAEWLLQKALEQASSTFLPSAPQPQAKEASHA